LALPASRRKNAFWERIPSSFPVGRLGLPRDYQLEIFVNFSTPTSERRSYIRKRPSIAEWLPVANSILKRFRRPWLPFVHTAVRELSRKNSSAWTANASSVRGAARRLFRRVDRQKRGRASGEAPKARWLSEARFFGKWAMFNASMAPLHLCLNTLKAVFRQTCGSRFALIAAP
jgi:hypothetical protein